MVAVGAAVPSRDAPRSSHLLLVTGWRERLGTVVAEYDLPVDAEERLATLLELLRDDPAAPTAVRAPERAVDTHVADALTALQLKPLRGARSIADLGAGAGLPGLPLAIALPDATVTLIESQARKCSFLRRAVTATAAANAVVACDRAETWAGRAQDAVTVRAVASLAVVVEYAAPLLRVGGSLVAWKGRVSTSERRDGDAAAGLVGLEPCRQVSLPPRATAEHRTLYVYTKVVQTSTRYPRRPGMARKRPLSSST